VHKHNAEAIEAVEAIPPLTERKVVGLRVDAEKTGEPPSPTTSKDDDPSQKP
jgi:hypothetical protein